MQFNQETGSKQHILAEDTPGKQLIPSLADLFIANYADCTVLAAFSGLERKLISYKITHPMASPEETEPWFREQFNRTVELTFTEHYQIHPELFSDGTYRDHDLVHGIQISYNREHTRASLHYLTALMHYHLTEKKNNQLYLYSKDQLYTLLLMNGETCLLANTYECKSEHEVLYFVLNSLQISDLLPSESTLHLDYSIINNERLVQFLSPHIATTVPLQYTFEGINQEIPQLAEKLFACHAAALCV